MQKVPNLKQALTTLSINLALTISLTCFSQLANAENQTPNYASTLQLANQGDAEAQNDLGNMYYNGKGVPQNYAKAVEWYSKATKQRYVHAQYRLGVSYEKGKGVPQNFVTAVEWYRKAANQGNADAQFNLGYPLCIV